MSGLEQPGQQPTGTAELASAADFLSLQHHNDIMSNAFAVVKDGITRSPALIAEEVAESVYSQMMEDALREEERVGVYINLLESVLTDEQRAQIAKEKEK